MSLTEILQMPAWLLNDFDLIGARFGKARKRQRQKESAKRALEASAKTRKGKR